jgi:hypothetical protein
MRERDMQNRASTFGAIAALGIMPFLGAPAWAAPCVSAPVTTYTAAGFSCNVDMFTFSNINVNTVTSDDGSILW